MKRVLTLLISLSMVFCFAVGAMAAAGDPVLEPIVITQIETTDKSGDAGTLVTGTAGTSTYAAVWDATGNVVDGPGVPAITTLSNIASTAIPVSLISDTAATDDLGTEAIYWLKAYLGTGISFEGATDNEFQTSIAIVDPTVGDKTITFPNSDQTVGVATSAAADAIDAITEIAAGLKTGSDVKLVTGTAGTDTYAAVWNGEGDLVAAAGPPAVGGGGGSLGSLTAVEAVSGVVTIGAANFIDVDGQGSAADDITEFAGSVVGDVIVVMASTPAGAYSITIKDGTYLLLQGDFIMNTIGDTITLVCTIAGANETYAELFRASNS